MLNDVMRDYRRAYLRYLLEEISVLPKKDFEVDIMGKKYRFVQGEEITVPRWLAEILANNDLVDIREEFDSSNVLSEAFQLSMAERKTPGVAKNPNILLKLKLFISREKSDKARENARILLKKLIDIRVPKIVKLALSLKDVDEKNFDPLEFMLYEKIKKYYAEWLENIFKE